MLDTRLKRWYDILGILENKHANSEESPGINSARINQMLLISPRLVGVVMVGVA